MKKNYKLDDAEMNLFEAVLGAGVFYYKAFRYLGNCQNAEIVYNEVL
jgi:hypothetical protein